MDVFLMPELARPLRLNSTDCIAFRLHTVIQNGWYVPLEGAVQHSGHFQLRAIIQCQ